MALATKVHGIWVVLRDKVHSSIPTVTYTKALGFRIVHRVTALTPIMVEVSTKVAGLGTDRTVLAARSYLMVPVLKVISHRARKKATVFTDGQTAPLMKVSG